jgi:hypothetical protein
MLDSPRKKRHVNGRTMANRSQKKSRHLNGPTELSNTGLTTSPPTRMNCLRLLAARRGKIFATCLRRSANGRRWL